MQLVLLVVALAAFSQGPRQQQRRHDDSVAAANQRGTERAPFVVKLDSAERREESRQQETERREKAATDDALARYTKYSLFANAILALGTLGLWIATWQLVRDARETAQRQLRAYVGLRLWHSTAQRAPGGTNTHAWAISAEFENYGNTPAIGAVIGIRHQWLDKGAEPEWKVQPFGDGATIDIGVHGGGATNPVILSLPEAVALWEEKKRLILLAVAEYRDVFPGTPIRMTSVCVDLVVQYDPRLSNKPFRFAALGPYNTST